MKKIFYCFFLIIFCSCNDKQMQFEDQSYEVLSILYDTLAIRLPIPPMPPSSRKLSKADSLRNVEKIIEFTRLRDSIKQIVAVNPWLSPAILEDINYTRINKDFKHLVEKLKLINEKKPLEVNRIKTKRKDSIIIFNDSLLDPLVSDFLKFNKLISFSRIVFNKQKNMAVIVASSSTSGRAGFSGLYFLRKINEQWVIVDYLGLSIS